MNSNQGPINFKHYPSTHSRISIIFVNQLITLFICS